MGDKDKIRFRFFLILFFYSLSAWFCSLEIIAKDYQLKKKSYLISAIPFEKKEITLPGNKLVISFSEYDKEVKLKYPSEAGNQPDKPLVEKVIRKSIDAIELFAADIVRLQLEDKAIWNYLTFRGKIKLPSQQEYINIVRNPAEQNIQIDSQNQNIIAQFRSAEIAIDEISAYCLYLTFIYEPQEEAIKKIIVSTVKLTAN